MNKKKGTMKRVVAYALSAALFAMGSMSAFAAAEEAAIVPKEGTVVAEEMVASSEVVSAPDTTVSLNPEEHHTAEIVAAEIKEAIDNPESEISATPYIVTENEESGETIISEITPEEFQEATGVTLTETAAASNAGTSNNAGENGSSNTIEVKAKKVNLRSTNNPDPGVVNPDPNANTTQPDEKKWIVDSVKEVADNQDGTYLLSVTITTKKVSGETSSYDVVFLVDHSTSLKDEDLEKEKAAVKKMSNQLEEKMSDDVSFAVIGFGSNTKNVTGGFTDADGVASNIDEIKRIGSTNMSDALIVANTVLKDSNTGHENKIVILMTDGAPNSAYATNEAAKTMELGAGDHFYAIYFGGNYNYVGQANGEKFLQDLVKNNMPSNLGNAQFFQSTPDNLAETMNTIAGYIGKVYDKIEGGELKDTLSASVDFVGSNYTLVIKDKDGNQQKLLPVSGEENTYDLEINGEKYRFVVNLDTGEKTVTIDFADDYPHFDGWTYSLETYIKLNDNPIAEKLDNMTVAYTNKNGEENGIEVYSYFKFTGTNDNKSETVTMALNRPYIVLEMNAPAGAAPAPTANPAPADTEDTVYLAPEAPEVLGATRETVFADEDPEVLGARRSVRTVDMTAVLPVFCFMMSGITFLCSRKKDDDNVA